MANVKQGQTLVGLRPNESDLRLLAKLGKKLGLGTTPLIRLALRVLAEKEGVTA